MGTAMAYPAPLIFKPSGGVESRDSGTGFVWFCVLQGSRGRAAGPEGVSMKLLRSAVLLAVAVTLAGVAGAHPDEDGALGFHDHLELLATSPPAPSASSRKVEVLSHVYPGPGTNADVYAHEGYAYLASWVGRGCLSKGVRVYDLSDPRNPVHVSTFADAAMAIRRSRARGPRR